MEFRPENRFLPSWWEDVTIRLFTDKRHWTGPQRKMMGRVGVIHSIRSALVVALLIALAAGGIAVRNRIERRQEELVAQKEEEQSEAEASRIVEGLLRADTTMIEIIIENLDDYREWASDDLSAAFGQSADDSNAKLHAALAMLTEDDSVLPYLRERLLDVAPVQFAPVRDLMESRRSELIPFCWQIANDPTQESTRRFQAACALASYDPQNESWRSSEFVDFLANHLVNVLPSELLPWRNALHPVKSHLISPSCGGSTVITTKVNRFDPSLPTRSPITWTMIPMGCLTCLQTLIHSSLLRFSTSLPSIPSGRSNCAKWRLPGPCHKRRAKSDREALASRQANAAVILIRIDQSANVWPLLKHSSDPQVRSYLVHRFNPLGVGSLQIVEALDAEVDISIRRALLLSLGEYGEKELSREHPQFPASNAARDLPY